MRLSIHHARRVIGAALAVLFLTEPLASTLIRRSVRAGDARVPEVLRGYEPLTVHGVDAGWFWGRGFGGGAFGWNRWRNRLIDQTLYRGSVLGYTLRLVLGQLSPGGARVEPQPIVLDAE